ncbi:hypothetical protein CsSME_00016737 [Camellia sinensis var. sinensis]
MWDDRIVSECETLLGTFSLSIKFRNRDNSEWWLIGDWWEELGGLFGLCAPNWCVGSEFNVVRLVSEKLNGASSNRSTRDFDSFIREGDGNIPFMLSLGQLTTLTEGFAMIGRMGKGSSYTPSKLPSKPLELWAYEPSPYCKIVREVLVELQLPHLLHRRVYWNVSHIAWSCPIFVLVAAQNDRCYMRKLDISRSVIVQRSTFQAPSLEDPNAGVQMFESAEIIDYLRATYAL